MAVTALLSSCARVTINDEEGCADIGSQGATCAHLLSPATRDIPQPEWDDIRFGYVCFSPASVGDFKEEIEKLCSVCDCCDYPESLQVKNFFKKMERRQR